jgi:diketogulonate reductase-like aldo/keto reductase
MERKIAVMAYFTFDRGRLFKRAGNTPLPEWAAEFGARTWAQFFIKYVLSHPAITVVRTGTINPAHMLENMQAGMGPLPNAAARKRMAALVDTLPPTPPPAPRGPVFEFEVDAQGKVIRAFLDQETPKGLQRMVLTRK